MIDLCICTHDPQPESLARAIASIAAQSSPAGSLHVLVVDNQSRRPVPESALQPLRNRGIEARLVREPTLGIVSARLRAIAETTGEWLIFVDDDNELAPDYVAQGADFILAHPGVGCFGGKSVLPEGLHIPDWAPPFLPYLAVIDHGEAEILAATDSWGPWEPACAGAWVHRDVLAEYSRRAAADPRAFGLGRVGKSGLGSCEDSLLMRGAVRVGRASAYVPALRLVHHLEPHRFKLGYLVRLLCGYGRSHVLLAAILEGGARTRPAYESTKAFIALLRGVWRRDAAHSVRFALAQFAYHLAARTEYRRQRRLNPLSREVALAQ